MKDEAGPAGTVARITGQATRFLQGGWGRWVLAGAVLAVLIVASVIGREQIMAIFADRGKVAAVVRDAGPWGPLLVIALVVAQVVAAPIPGQALNFVAAYVYGFWLGVLYSWLGAVIGSILAMGLARWLGRPLIERLVAPDALARLDRLAEGQGLRFFFLIWLLPFLPDDLACFLAGLTPLPLPALIVVAAVGRLPGVMVAAWLGANAEQLTWQAWVVIGLLTLGGVLLVWRYGERLQNLLLARITRR